MTHRRGAPSRADPYTIEGPALISVSGGRTSAFMLRKILDANGGLPPDTVACFANTGLEHPKTLDFLHELETRWCPIVWLEYCVKDGKHAFRIVRFETASRDGQPFRQLIRKKRFLPNPVMRICTDQLKVSTMRRYMQSRGWKEYDSVIGLRADEPRRLAKIKGGKIGTLTPMASAGHSIEAVLAFWRDQPFDLELPWKDVGVGNAFGNCVGCFLKSRRKIEDLMRAEPQHFRWWIRMEEEIVEMTGPGPDGRGPRFRGDRPSYAEIMQATQRQGRLFEDDDEETVPCMCHD